MVRKTWIDVSECDHSEVRDELERILASPPFSNSRRYPALLRYVVEKSLSGKAGELKERTVGIEVFHRPPDYDTANDPVVRFSASEVRRRIAQYYQEEGHRKTIEIGLPSGAYIPQFARLDPSENPVESHPQTESRPATSSEHTASEAAHLSTSQNAPIYSMRSFSYGLGAGLLAIAVIVSVGHFLIPKLFRKTARNAAVDVWNPLLTNPEAVIINVGRTRVEGVNDPEPLNSTIEEHILRPEARISLSSVEAVSQVAGFLEAQRKQFRVDEAYSSNLQELHGRPVVLISGFNNMWSLLLLKPLRFRFEQSNSVHSIVDTQYPDRSWSVDFNTPYLQQSTDYAIVARFFDPTTGGPVVVVAGIGSNGSQAAGEFVVSPSALQALARSAPDGTLDQNFEAVLKVEVVRGNTGAATVVASEFW